MLAFLLCAAFLLIAPGQGATEEATETPLFIVPRKLTLPTPIDRILPGGTSAILAVDRQVPKILLIDTGTGEVRASKSFEDTPQSLVPIQSASGDRTGLIVIEMERNRSGSHSMEVFDITADRFKLRESFLGAIPAEFAQPAARYFYLPKQGNNIVTWDRSLDPRTVFYRIFTEGSEKGTDIQTKLYPYELLDVKDDQFMLALHPQASTVSLIEVNSGFFEDSISVDGLSFHDPTHFAVFSSNAVDGGTGDVIIANGDAELLTVLSLEKASQARIGRPIQISLKGLDAIRDGHRQLLVAANSELSTILVGAVGSNRVGVFRRFEKGIEEADSIVLDAPIRDMTVLHSPQKPDSESFIFLRDDGGEILVVPRISDLISKEQTTIDPIPVDDGQETAFTSTHLEAMDIARLQRVLAELGYAVGAIDGKMGQSTASAIRGFQLDRGLKVAGTIDKPTINALNVLVAYRKFIDENVKGVRAERLLTLGVSHIDPNSKCFGLNSIPPHNLWPNSVDFARILKRLEEGFKLQVNIVSGYRNPVYGTCASRGDEDGTHLNFQAFDIRLANATTFAEGNERLLEVLTKMRNSGEFKGGLGSTGRSVHVDTRGTNVDVTDR